MTSINIIRIGLAMFLFISCVGQKIDEKSETVAENKGLELIKKMVDKVGDYQALLDKNDVVYEYSYLTPDSARDLSIEKYVFDGELSYGYYIEHKRTFPEMEGSMEQGYDGDEFWLKFNKQESTNKQMLKKVSFARPTNFYWFTMMQKLLDPGLNYEYIGTKDLKNKQYDIVRVSFDTPENEASDIYQLYINKATNLVDQFLFTVADYGIMEEPFLMEVTYEVVDGIYIPANRRYKKSSWDAEVSNEPWTEVNWRSIKFDNGLTKDDFSK